MVREQTFIVLNPDHIERLKRIIAVDTVRGLVATWRAIMRANGECWETAESVDPKAYALCRSQWHDLCQAMIVGSTAQGHGGFTNGNGMWMNSGPSCAQWDNCNRPDYTRCDHNEEPSYA